LEKIQSLDTFNGSELSEKKYRAHSANSYSTIKTFIEDRKKYYKKYILKENIEDKITKSLTIGTLVDILLNPHENIDNYVIEASNNKPTGQMLDFTETLFDLHSKYLDEDTGKTSRSMTVMMEEAFNICKYDRDGKEIAFKKKKFEYVIDKFSGTKCEEYFNELIKSRGKVVINPSDREDADKVVEGLLNTPWTRNILLQENDTFISVYD